MSDNYHEEQRGRDERNEQDREYQRRQEYNRNLDRQNDQRKADNRRDEGRLDYNYEQDRYNEETENARRTRENEKINRELLSKGDISGFAIRNDLPYYLSGSNPLDADEQPRTADSSDVQFSYEQKQERYRNSWNEAYLQKNTLLQEITNLSLQYYPYDPLGILRSTTSMRNNTLQTISNYIINIDPESKEQIDALDMQRKVWGIDIPELSMLLRDFVTSCQSVQFWKFYLNM